MSKILARSAILLIAVLLPLFPAQAEPDAESLLRQTVEAWLANFDGGLDWVGPERSLEEMQADVEDRPDDSEALMKLGLRYILAKQAKSPTEYLKRAVSIEPNSAPAHTLLAWAYMGEFGSLWKGGVADETDSAAAEEFFGLATEEFATAVRLDPRGKYIWVLWAVFEFGRSAGNVLLLPTTDPEPIIEKLRRARHIDPGDSGLAALLGRVLYSYAALYLLEVRRNISKIHRPTWMVDDLKGQSIRYSKEAANLYRFVLEDHPQMFWAHNRYVETLAMAELYEKAVEGIKNATTIYADDRERKSKVKKWERNLIEFMERQKASSEAIAKVRAALADRDPAPN